MVDLSEKRNFLMEELEANLAEYEKQKRIRAEKYLAKHEAAWIKMVKEGTKKGQRYFYWFDFYSGIFRSFKDTDFLCMQIFAEKYGFKIPEHDKYWNYIYISDEIEDGKSKT